MKGDLVIVYAVLAGRREPDRNAQALRRRQLNDE